MSYISPADMADRLGLFKSRRGWRGTCPACGYFRTFELRDANGTVFGSCASCHDQPAIAEALANLMGDGPQPPAQRQNPPDPAARRDAALAVWNGADPVPGTPAERYLGARCLPGLVDSPALRYRRDCRHPEQRGIWPAMVALVVDVHGKPQAVHRTYLKPDGSAKADVEPAKASKGAIAGGVIRLHPVAEELVIAEGIETAASSGVLLHLPAWSAIAAGNLERLALPREVRRVVIAADPDPPGERAARAAALRWTREGRTVRIARPNSGGDFNDVLRGAGR